MDQYFDLKMGLLNEAAEESTLSLGIPEGSITDIFSDSESDV